MDIIKNDHNELERLADGPAVQSREPASVVEQPSDEERTQFLFESFRGPIEFVCEAEEESHLMIRNHVKFARAVLARWGRPAPQPPADGEVRELVRQLGSMAADAEAADFVSDAAVLDLAIKHLERLVAPQPIPVSERLPWTASPDISGRYLCLRDGEFRLLDVNYCQDFQMGVSGQWDATEVCSGTRHGWTVESLQPAQWLMVAALPLPAAEVEQ